MKLKISEIFYSILGEGVDMGIPTIFLRLFGCNLRCTWCDSMYAVEGKEYKIMKIENIIREIELIDCKRICITGGEPLLQQEPLIDLVQILVNKNFNIILETAGHIEPDPVFQNKQVVISMDCKCPSSNMEQKTNNSILKKLNKKDQIKFVVKDQKDYDYAKQIIVKEKFQAEIIMQPVFGTKISIIADLVLKDNLPVRVLPQLHKSIWGDKRGV